MAFGKAPDLLRWLSGLTPAAATRVFFVASSCWLLLANRLLDYLFANRPDLREASSWGVDMIGILSMSAIVYLLTERMEARHLASEQSLREQSSRDGLTALYNRQAFDEFVNKSIKSAQRRRETLALLFLDLDHFKTVNDRRGRFAGDALLVETARRLAEVCARGEDLVARVGGDEFAILLREPNLPEGLSMLAERILESVSAPFQVQGQPARTTACLGIALYPDDGQEAVQLFNMAELALTQAKEQGRSKYCYYGGEWQQQRDQRMQLELGLLRAIAHDELFLMYQPKLDTGTMRVIGVEALVRWNHPHLGCLGAPEFVPLADKAGLVWGLTGWVLKAACRQAAEWYRKEGLDVNVAVNISPSTFAHQDLEQVIERELAESGLPPDRLTLEITEETLMVYESEFLEVLERLHRMGVSVQIDDFGTGYSSLSSMKHYHFQALKIDRSFVRDVVTSSGDAAIVTTIMFMAKCLDMEAIAEGVETDEQREFLTSIGCRYMQGFYFSRPLMPHDLSAFIFRLEEEKG